MNYDQFQEHRKLAIPPTETELKKEPTVFDKHKAWVIELFQKQLIANASGKPAIDVQILCANSAGFRFLCHSCYRLDVIAGELDAINKLPMEQQLLIKQYAIDESQGKLKPHQIKELGKCYYWFDQLISKHINQ